MLAVLNMVVVVPVYKGGRKDPMKTDRYRGVMLHSMIAKVLEFILFCFGSLVCLTSTSLPTDLQFRVRTHSLLHKSLLRAISEKKVGYTCVCVTFQKAFYSVEYSVRLNRHFDAGINGKMLRLLKNLDGRL